MKNLIEDYTAALNQAKELPTHVDGELQDHYVFFGENKTSFKIAFSENPTPVSIYRASKIRPQGATRFYIKKVPTYRADGTLKKMRDWEEKLMFHKAWSRNDIEITEVKFDIVGMKRETTRRSAGVLIDNIEFIK